MAEENKSAGYLGLEIMLARLTGLTVEPAGITRAKADDLERTCFATTRKQSPSSIGCLNAIPAHRDGIVVA